MSKKTHKNQNIASQNNTASAPPAVAHVLNNHSQQLIGVKQMRLSTSFHVGPIPPADELAKYNQIIANGADRIMTLAENQSKHRIAIEAHVIEKKTDLYSRGQICAVLVSFLGITCGTACVLSGHDVAGAIIAGTPLVSIVSAFLYNKEKQSAELKNKRPPENPPLDKPA
jgi:uncharacterized membrane protein